jgi:hypothetical protein
VPEPPPGEPAFVRLEPTLLAPREPDPEPEIAGERVVAGGDGVAAVAGVDGEEGRGAGMVATGWTKWKPVPEKGSVTLRGRVVDRNGRPLPGGQVWLAEEGGIVDFLGECGDDGRFEIRRRPARPHRLWGNWCGAARDAAGRIPPEAIVAVEPREGETVGDLELRVPVDRERTGSVTGRVLDDEGRPVRASVFCGMQEASPDARGRFRFAAVPEGEAEVLVDDYGHRRWRRTVAVRPRESVDVEIVLVPSRTGNLEVGGRVRDDAGRPVGGISVWCGGVEGVSREVRAEADGAFLFRRLPEPAEGEAYAVSVFDFGPGEPEPYLPVTVNGIAAPDRRVEVVLERTALLRVVVRDAPSGDLLPLFNCSLERERIVDGEPRLVPFHGATLHEEDGAWEAAVPRTRVVLFVEAPDHLPSHLAVEIPREGGRFEVVVPMAR